MHTLKDVLSLVLLMEEQDRRLRNNFWSVSYFNRSIDISYHPAGHSYTDKGEDSIDYSADTTDPASVNALYASVLQHIPEGLRPEEAAPDWLVVLQSFRKHLPTGEIRAALGLSLDIYTTKNNLSDV